MSTGVGAGSAGTCFSGGSGSGGIYAGTNFDTFTGDAGINGGEGTQFASGTGGGGDPDPPSGSASGAGNPNGDGSGGDPVHDGTGGVLIIFVEGTITKDSIAKHFTANGASGKTLGNPGFFYPGVNPFGGATGGGIVILVNNGDNSNNVEARGGVTPLGRGGGNGAAVALSFSQL